jgi:RNA polymerase sigma factor (TIGR02999 family)
MALMSGEVTSRLNADFGPELDEAVYTQLRDLARRELRRLGGRRTLNPTALVNEAWLKVAAGHQPWQSRAHFLAAMARVMRHVLIDHAREQGALRRGGDVLQVTLEHAADVGGEATEALELLALDRALQALAERDSRLERAVELRFFAGLTIPEIAEVMSCSEPTVKRDLRAARAYLAMAMGAPP